MEDEFYSLPGGKLKPIKLAPDAAAPPAAPAACWPGGGGPAGYPFGYPFGCWSPGVLNPPGTLPYPP